MVLDSLIVNLDVDIDLSVLLKHPKLIAVKLEKISFVSIRIPSIKVQLPSVEVPLEDLDVSIPIPLSVKFHYLPFALEIAVGIFLILIKNVFRFLLDIFVLLFNIAMIWESLASFEVILVHIPTLPSLQLSLSVLLGPIISKLVYIMEDVFSFLNILKSVGSSWNCGGTLTLLTPFLFMIGAFIVWIVLQRDFILYLGIKYRVNARNMESSVKREFWEMGSKLMVKVSILTLQATILVLAEATLISITDRSCSELDFVSNTIGKVIGIVFVIFFYFAFFFIFTGSPNWDKYKRISWYLSFLWVTYDGIIRFSELTLGIWTDSTVKAYNIIGRAQRYMKDAIGNKSEQEARKGLGGKIEDKIEGKLTGVGSGASTKVDSMQEETMYIIAASRSVRNPTLLSRGSLYFFRSLHISNCTMHDSPLSIFTL